MNAKGDLYVIRNNQPQYVVLSEVRYRELMEAQEEAYLARVRASFEDLKAGRVRRFASAEELLNALNSEDETYEQTPTDTPTTGFYGDLWLPALSGPVERPHRSYY